MWLCRHREDCSGKRLSAGIEFRLCDRQLLLSFVYERGQLVNGHLTGACRLGNPTLRTNVRDRIVQHQVERYRGWSTTITQRTRQQFHVGPLLLALLVLVDELQVSRRPLYRGFRLTQLLLFHRLNHHATPQQIDNTPVRGRTEMVGGVV
jgi:hypothetical protein